MDQWYLRSDKDSDTHYGQASDTDDAMVTARCGLTFRPLQELFGDGPAVVRSDALRACPRCRSASERQPDADGAAVLGLIDTLSSPLRKKGTAQ